MGKRIGELLVEQGACTADDLQNALTAQQGPAAGQRLGTILRAVGKVTSEALARALGTQHELPFSMLPATFPPDLAKLVPLDYQREYRLVPFLLEGGDKLSIAVADPVDLQPVDDLRFQLQKSIRISVTTPEEIERALAAQSGEKPSEDLEAILVLEEESGSHDMPSEWGEEIPITEVMGDATPARATASPLAAPPATTVTAAVPAPVTDVRPPPPPSAMARPPPPPPSAGVPIPLTAKTSPVAMVKFGGAASKGTEGRTVVTESPAPPSFTDEDLQVLESLEKMSQGESPTLHTEKVKPAQMVASLIRLLIKKRVIGETEFLEELSRK